MYRGAVCVICNLFLLIPPLLSPRRHKQHPPSPPTQAISLGAELDLHSGLQVEEACYAQVGSALCC